MRPDATQTFHASRSDAGIKADKKAERLRAKLRQVELEKAILIQVAAGHRLALDALEAANAQLSQRIEALTSRAQPATDEDIAWMFKDADPSPELLAESLTGHLLQQRLPGIKAELRRLIVEPVEQRLRDFERENKNALAKIPKPQKRALPQLPEPPPGFHTADYRPINSPAA